MTNPADADDVVGQVHEAGADAIELHTGPYAHAPADPRTLRALADAAALGASLGMAVHAGHGLSVQNVGPVAAIPEIEELNIGHAIVAEALFKGWKKTITDMKALMVQGRAKA